jgi:thioesterase domain-containing protein/acyl carrier protein
MVPLTHANLCASSAFYIDILRLQPEDRLLGAIPIYQITGVVFALTTVISGSSFCAAPGFHGARFADWMDEYRPSWIFAPPAALRDLVQHMKSRRDVIARCPLRMVRSGASAVPAQLQMEADEVFRAPVIVGYGVTEAATYIACNPLPFAVRKPGSVGLPTGPEVMVMLPSGRPAATGEQGEIVIRGPNVMQEYEDDTEATRLSFVNGWFRTGDLGWRDTEGYLYLTGRLRELINRGGQKISPAEVEERLMHHPAIKDAAVFAIPHPRLSEDVAAAVVLHEGAKASEREVRLFAASGLAAYKIPARICFLTELPHGPSGKVQRFELARQLGPELVSARHPEPEAFVAPKTSTELSLAQMWSEVLGISRIGIHDDFFALGGDSFAAAALLAEVRGEFGLEVGQLDRIDFMDAPTIADMARLIEGNAAGTEKHRAESEGLVAVALQPSGPAPPFFCVPGVYDDPFELLPLSRSMGLDQPFYALGNSVAIADRNVYTLSDVAEKYARAIRRIQPNGPYYLGGYCFGGIVAYETARQLRTSGAAVALLVLLDTFTPGYPSFGRHWKLYLAALRFHLLSKWGRKEWAHEVKRDFRCLCAHCVRVARGAAERFLKHRHTSLLRPQRTVCEANQQAARLYQPARYPGKIMLLNAKEHTQTGSPLDRRRGWFELADGEVEEHLVNCSHETMLAEPYVAETSTHLRALIEEASATPTARSKARLAAIAD